MTTNTNVYACEFLLKYKIYRIIVSMHPEMVTAFPKGSISRPLLTYTIFAWLCTHLVLATPASPKFKHSPHQEQEANITFTLFATDMSGCDSTSACDLYVNISCTSKTSDWQSCGQTSKRQDDNFPVWPEIFTYSHFPGTSQRWKFELIDVDVAFDDIIGTIEMNMDEYVDAPGNLYQVPVPENTGILWIHRMR